MFDIGSTELLLIIIVAVIVIGPKDLPRALYKVGQVVGKARAMSRHFRTGIDTMMREAELAELEKKWAAENKRIMEEHPTEDMAPADAETPALPAPSEETPPAHEAAPDSAMPEYSRQTQAIAQDEAKALETKTDEAPKDGAPA